MSIRRFSFYETPDWKDAIGFQVRCSLTFRTLDTALIVNRGSLVYGFNTEEETYGYVLDNDEPLYVPSIEGVYYLTMSKYGTINIQLGNKSDIHGLGFEVPGIPWYTYAGDALIGKVFNRASIVTGYIVCDDAYWAEYEGSET